MAQGGRPHAPIGPGRANRAENAPDLRRITTTSLLMMTDGNERVIRIGLVPVSSLVLRSTLPPLLSAPLISSVPGSLDTPAPYFAAVYLSLLSTGPTGSVQRIAALTWKYKQLFIPLCLCLSALPSSTVPPLLFDPFLCAHATCFSASLFCTSCSILQLPFNAFCLLHHPLALLHPIIPSSQYSDPVSSVSSLGRSSVPPFPCMLYLHLFIPSTQ